ENLAVPQRGGQQDLECPTMPGLGKKPRRLNGHQHLQNKAADFGWVITPRHDVRGGRRKIRAAPNQKERARKNDDQPDQPAEAALPEDQPVDRVAPEPALALPFLASEAGRPDSAFSRTGCRNRAVLPAARDDQAGNAEKDPSAKVGGDKSPPKA